MTTAAEKPTARRKRVGDVWMGPTGAGYRVNGFDGPGTVLLTPMIGGPCVADSTSIDADKGWTLVEAGAGEEEPKETAETVTVRTLIAAALAYKRARAADVAALRELQTRSVAHETAKTALEALRRAALGLVDDGAGRKKRVGDVWANPRGRYYRITGFDRPGHGTVVSLSTGISDGFMGPMDGWTLVQAGTGEEEP